MFVYKIIIIKDFYNYFNINNSLVFAIFIFYFPHKHRDK